MDDLSVRFLEYARLDRKRSDEGLTVAELERWGELKRALTLHFSPGLDPREVDRRRSVRVPTRLRVRYAVGPGFERSPLTKLSRCGAFVETRQPLPVGSRLSLRIAIEESGEEIEVPAVVVTSHRGPAFDEGEIGMGLRFADLPPETAKRLGDLYEHVIRSEFGGSEGEPARDATRSKPQGSRT